MGVQLFYYKLIFLAELLLITGLFVFRLKRRKLFWLRLSVSLAACFLFTFFYPLKYFNAAYVSVMFIAIFAAVLCALKFCFDETLLNVLFCGTAAYTIRHLAFLLYNFVVVAFGLVQAGAMGAYLDMPMEKYNAWTIFTYFVTYYVVYWLSFLFFGRKIKHGRDLSIQNFALLLLCIFLILVDVVFNAVIVYYSAENFDYTYVVMDYLYGIVSCALVIFIQFTLLGKKQLKAELDTVRTLRAQEHKQYIMSRDNIELINVKCHDLKHQLSMLRGRVDERELEEIEKAVMIYDNTVKTGNEVLDVLLSEKSLFCEKNGIQLSCAADVGDLSFMTISDLYSLFGNAIDNGIEAVMKLDDKEKRLIGINVRCAGRLLSLHIENFFSGGVKFVGGLPQTTKSDKRYHGFGMKSIKFIAEKYGGNVVTRADGDKFKLDVMIPITIDSAAKSEPAAAQGQNV